MTHNKKNWLTTTTGIITSVTSAIAAITALVATVANLPFWSAEDASTPTQEHIQASDITTGLWVSNNYYKESAADFHFDLLGKTLVGTYNNEKEDAKIINGAITHNLDKHTMIVNAFWVENKSNKECATLKDGSKYWGQLRLEFTSTSAFVGSWGIVTMRQIEALLVPNHLKCLIINKNTFVVPASARLF